MKKLMSIILCVCLLGATLAGCKKNDLPQKSTGEKVKIKYVRPGTPPEQNEVLIKAINDKLETDEMNLELDIMYIPGDAYLDKTTMMLSAGDKFDIIAIMEDQKALSSYVAMDALAPIGEYLEQYGSNIKKVIPDWMWESATFNNKIYTIPANWTEIADQANNITIRRDKLDEYGLKDPETREDLLNMCKVFTEKWTGDQKPLIIPMYKEPFTWLFRTLETYPFTVQKDLIFIDQDGKVKNWMETEEFKVCAEFFAECYDKGYISKDVMTPTWSSWNQLCSGNFIWCDGCQLWGTKEVWNERVPGVNMDTIYLNPGAESFRPTSFRNDNAVSITSDSPADAIRFMDWVYASQENYDLMVYGVEGLTYKNEGDGFYSKFNPDFEFNPDYIIGNLEYIRYEVGTYDKFIEIMGKEKPNATNSIVLNFQFDPTKVSVEFANCLAEVERSIYPIKLGIVSYEKGYADALAKMKAAGIDKIITEYQTQLDAFLAK